MGERHRQVIVDGRDQCVVRGQDQVGEAGEGVGLIGPISTSRVGSSSRITAKVLPAS